MYCHVLNWMSTDLMMEAARTSETSVDIQLRTRQYIPEDSELQPALSFHIWGRSGGLPPNLHLLQRYITQQISRWYINPLSPKL
jgi:hypothetical protein